MSRYWRKGASEIEELANVCRDVSQTLPAIKVLIRRSWATGYALRGDSSGAYFRSLQARLRVASRDGVQVAVAVRRLVNCGRSFSSLEIRPIALFLLIIEASTSDIFRVVARLSPEISLGISE